MHARNLALIVAMAFTVALSMSVARAGLPYPHAGTPNAIDRGPLSTQATTTPISVTVALRLPNLAAAENLLIAVTTPGNPQYHQFLTGDQFVARFGPSDADVAKVVAGLAKYGLTVERTSATTLKVTGMPAALERAFAVNLHIYEVPAHEDAPAYTFHAPVTRETIPGEIAGLVSAVAGLDDRPRLRPLHTVAPLQAKPQPGGVSAATGNSFGSLTVADFASLYDVNPLYAKGVSGRDRTIGIMTLASFTPSDAYAYWKALGLSVRSHRIRIVNVDGGPGAPSDVSGSVETTLDVEQSGGLAPGARIVVYQAPNTNQGFVDVFAAAVDANVADSLSISWGQWEWFSNLQNGPVTDPITGATVGTTQAVHELLVRAAIQGQTVFAASGDSGAYELNRDLGCYGPYSSTDPSSCSLTLSVSIPASDPAITAAGGTTLPGEQDYCLNAACTPPYYVIALPRERVWGWDYLDGLCAALGYPDPILCGTFSGGSGGGVSVVFNEPFYQQHLSGVRRSEPGQLYQAGTSYAALGLGLYYALPSRFSGRNVPDISANADPQTGYVIYYTSEPSGVFGQGTSNGGTSFVAPQLAGVSALLGEYTRGRLGLLNVQLYGLAQSERGYEGQGAPLRAIVDGDNWFYSGRNGYSPAAGLGTLDVANFASYLRNPF
jgi:kumamolisin